MLFVPITWRANLPARKFISFDALEHEKMPNEVDVSASRAFGETGGCPVERLVPARGPELAVLTDEGRRQPCGASAHLLQHGPRGPSASK